MAVPPEEWTYEAPPLEDCRVDEYFIQLDDTDRLEVRVVEWRGLVVNFVLVQVTTLPNGKDVHVARIDCCHSDGP